MLAVALLGFLLLINLLGSLTSSGPDDLLAIAPSEERHIGLPSGAGMFAFAIGAVGIILGVVAIAGIVSLARQDESTQLRRYLLAGAVVVIVMAGVSLFLAFSGVLSENMAYGQHQALRSNVQPKGLAVLGAFFLSLVLIGVLRPKLLFAHLAAWLVIALIFGFFGSDSLAGLNLFDEAEGLEARDAYAAEVEKYRKPQAAIGDVEAVHWDSTLPLTNGNAAYFRGSSILLDPGTSALPSVSSSPSPLFTVTGAENTSLLRSATGDVYKDGEWLQLDPVSLDSEAWDDLPRGILDMIDAGLLNESLIEQGLDALDPLERSIPDLLAQPSAAPDSLNIDHISVSPAEGFESLEPGTVPIAALPLSIGEEGSWNPFSQTFQIGQSLESYEWRSMAVEYAEPALAEAEAVTDPTYYQLPGDLPQRVRDLAGQITQDLDSPYEKAQAIEQYLKSEYSYREPQPGQQPLMVPEGQDPVDWFLFDERAGGATSFSSAFSVLARAADVPARVVSGWAISPNAEKQTVHSDQAHQWAEVGLQQYGWVPFDPTPGGAPEKVAARNPRGTPTGAGDGLPGGGDGIEQGSPGDDMGMGQGSGGPSDAGEELTDFREEVALRNLAEALNPEVREQAAEILGKIGSDRAIEGLADAMFNDPEESVREASIDSMASLEFEQLEGILQDHPDPLLRKAAALSLGKKGDPRALSPLGNSLVNQPDTSEDVRAAAADALGDLLQPEAVEPLSQALATDSSSMVRKAGAGALGTLGQQSGAGSLEQALVADAEEDVRAAAADALGGLLSPSSLPPLLEARENDPSPKVRGKSNGALNQFGQPGLGQALEESDDSSVRAAAAQVLGEQGGSSAADNLIDALQDSDDEVKEAAQEAVENLGSVTPLENGSGLLSHEEGTSFMPGTTSGQAGELPHVPVFEVEGAEGVDFLRIAVGDRYENGQWYPDQQATHRYTSGSSVPDPGPAAVRPATATRTQTSQITVSPPSGEQWILEGSVPIASRPIVLSLPGTLFPDSETFSSSNRVPTYGWTSSIPVYSEEQLRRAAASPHYGHKSVPAGMPARVQALALRITSGHSTQYQKAKAIEQYVRTNYTYRLADPSQGGVPAGRDPVDWFLFESLEGTCGNFSSAFVVLARSVGLPARVVSGWSISPTDDRQTVYADQAHQRAEIAFDGMGWVSFEPTASGGAPARAETGAQGGGSSQQERQEIENLVQQLSEGHPGDQEQARQELEDAGAEIFETENGGNVVTKDDESFSIGVGTSTRQEEQPGTRPVFSISGAEHTKYLRSLVGDIYEDGNWRQLDRVSLDYDASQSIPHLVRNEIARLAPGTGFTVDGPVTSALLAGFEVNPPITYTDKIVIEASPELGNLPAGVIPTSQFLDEVDQDGRFHPVSGTYSLDRPVESFTWVSRVPQYSSSQLEDADVVSDSIYTQLPDGLPDRIRDLAQDITSGHSSPYAKAQALERYLSTQYTYRFADGSGSEAPPPGRDPVDWFLFDHREGTCGVFSTAFVVMARSIGISARVASGWAISPTNDRQEVQTNQAHQWAEVAFEGLGWVQFEPTGSSGAPSRTEQMRELRQDGQGQDSESSQTPVGDEEEQPPSTPEDETEQPPVGDEQQPIPEEEEDEEESLPTQRQEQAAELADTATEITTWPERVRRRIGFTIGGTLRTAGGGPVSDMQVEIFINETKEYGGTKIGETTAQRGSFRVEVSVPSSMERGPYQLIAHAIANEQYSESWSDPDLTVYSESGLQLTGPGEIPVDTQALFRGKLVDDTGSGVGGLEVQVEVDGRSLPPQSTDDAGEFAFAQTFTELGAHTVEVGIEGRDFLLGNTARLEVQAVMPTELTVNVPGDARIGEEFLIEGFLRDVRGQSLPQVEITFTVDDGPPWSATTGANGEFRTAGAIDAVGHSIVRAEFDGAYPVLPSAHSTTVTARYLTEMTISGPSSVAQGEEALFRGRIASRSVPDIGSVEVVIEDRDGAPIDTVVTGSDGSFEYRSPGFDNPGPRILTARFHEQDDLTSSSASFSFSTVAPTVLTVDGPSVAAAQGTVELTGTLRTTDDQPVPGVPVWVGSPGSQPLITDADGAFVREFPLAAELGQNGTESIVNISFGFNGTDRLAPALRNHSITVGLPWLFAEPTELVARGETATLRGTVFIGSRPLSDVVVSAGEDIETLTNATGSFILRYPVDSDVTLGRNEVQISVADLDLEAMVPVDVKSTTNLVVVPLGDVRSGREAILQATLFDDEGRGIPDATVRTSQGERGVTDDSGVAQLVIEVSDTGDVLAVPVTFTYEGDGIHLPLTYFTAIPLTQSGFNWLLWVGLPAVVVAVLVSGFIARGLNVFAGIGGSRSGDATPEVSETAVAVGPLPENAESVEYEPEPVPDPEPTQLEISLERPAAELPEVWGSGEQVAVLIALTVEDGPKLPRAPVELVIPGGDTVTLQTDESGRCGFTWQVDRLGELTFTAEFTETELYLQSSGSAGLRVVDFREEIVRLYNSFVAWAEPQVPPTAGRTPRELESVLAASGISMDFRTVAEIISRFEEADYSEHEIGRRQYESMYRAWYTITGEPELDE